jgi:plasmid stabilization system protein ParE
MSFRFVHRPAVADNIACAMGHYRRISPDLADRFLISLREASGYLIKYSKAFAIRYRQVRTLSMRNFPFLIHYIVDDERREVVILAVCHASRDFADLSEH